mmetsp:Transcript_37727/g.70355  ORF Transcript_37727/g.70355 Transcript_37727/m.70355 type:complete len:135 (-) Transcript_37727:117-521(-)
MQKMTRGSRKTWRVVVLILALWAMARLPSTFVSPRATPSPVPKALGVTGVFFPAAAHAVINQEAYYAAAGIDPNEVKNQMIDQMSDTDAALQGASDFFFEIFIPFSAGAGLVYGIGISTGQLEGPFKQDEDQKS